MVAVFAYVLRVALSAELDCATTRAHPHAPEAQHRAAPDVFAEVCTVARGAALAIVAEWLTALTAATHACVANHLHAGVAVLKQCALTTLSTADGADHCPDTLQFVILALVALLELLFILIARPRQ